MEISVLSKLSKMISRWLLFSTENKLLAYFLSLGELSFDSYSKLCQEYYERSHKSNQYLYLFDMAPPVHLDKHGESDIKSFFQNLLKLQRRILRLGTQILMENLIYGLMVSA